MTRSHSKADVLAKLRDIGIIPVIRAESTDIVIRIVEALVKAGLTVAEITMTVPNAIQAIASVEEQFGSAILLGAGTVTDAHTARRAIDAGAEFIVSPCLVGEVVDAARGEDVAALPGGLTPTEIFEAFRRGADMVKVFPAQNVGGASYLRALRGPFPDIPLVPTGGVNFDNIGDLFSAGAAAVGVGSELLSKEAVARRDFPAIGALARRFVEAARAARAR